MAQPAAGAGRQAPAAGLLLAAALAGCANVGDPPGGPPDTAPPAIVRVVPESGAVVPGLKGNAVISFDEVIDEMAGGGGGGRGGGGQGLSGLARQVVLSPVAGAVNVSWHHTAIHVKPAEGWKAGRVYRLELLPGILDLRRNRLSKGRTLIFSTGPALPHAALSGTALLWVEQRALVQGLIRAVRLPDTVGYVTLADSSGDFRLQDIPPGDYVVYAVQDQNGNRERDRREAYDSVAVTVDTAATALLWAFVHDSAGARLRAAEPIDSLTFRLVFSQPLNPRVRLDTSRVNVFALPDTTPLAVSAVLTPAQYDSLTARERARVDSLRRAAGDTVAAGGVPAPAAPRAPAVAGTPPAAQQRPPARGMAPGAAGARGAAATGATPLAAPPVDTARIRRLLRQRPVPSDRLVVRMTQPLAAGARYFIRARGATNLNGAAADGQAVLTVPKPSAKPAAAPRDTTRPPAPKPPAHDSTPPPL